MDPNMPTSTDEARTREQMENEPFVLKFYTESAKAAPARGEGFETEAVPVESDPAVDDIVERLRRTLSKIDGVTNVRIDPATRRATFDYSGTWNDTEALQRTIAASVPAYLLRPAPIYVKLTYPAACDKAVLGSAILGTAGVRHAHLLPSAAEVQFDVEAGEFEDVLTVFVNDGFKLLAGSSHRLGRFKVKGEGDLDALRARLDNTKGILKVAQAEDGAILVTAYGKAWKDDIEPAVKACGFEMDGKLLVK